MTRIIDCHGHYTTCPAPHNDWRQAQLAAFEAVGHAPAYPDISDDLIAESIETKQLKLIKERGADMTMFSPRASAMAHHLGDDRVSQTWSRHCNTLIKRVVDLYPDTFVGVCMLPQSPGVPIANSIEELERCVTELGFIGCNLNPDPTGTLSNMTPLTDKSWYPFYEKMVELDVPAMIHVSGSSDPALHSTGSYYISADTTAFMQFIQGDLFKDFPDLRFIIPHGGGAVPYHWGRYRGLADMLSQPSLEVHVMKNIFFDTCVYDQVGIDCLFDAIDINNLLFGSEMIGAVRGVDPKTGRYFDDTKQYVDALDLTEAQRHQVYEGNARRVYPRLDALLKAKDAPDGSLKGAA
ncbi:MAG: amidohydrolase family protein [Pseudomonadota bacterium]